MLGRVFAVCGVLCCVVFPCNQAFGQSSIEVAKDDFQIDVGHEQGLISSNPVMVYNSRRNSYLLAWTKMEGANQYNTTYLRHIDANSGQFIEARASDWKPSLTRSTLGGLSAGCGI